MPFRILRRFDENALRRAGGRTAEAGHAAGRPILPDRETMQASVTQWVGSLLFRIGDGIDAIIQRFEHGVVALPEHEFLGVLEKVLHQHFHSFGCFGDIRLNAKGPWCSSGFLPDDSST
mgnify:CR=1 FL=1